MFLKELLSLVLKMEVNHIPQQTSSKHIEFYSKTICNYYELMEDYSTAHGYLQRINIYELAHKCKEWASNNQFTLVSGDSGHGFVCSVGHYSNNAINAEFYGENEFNAVIQGCEWILKEHPCNQLT